MGQSFSQIQIFKLNIGNSLSCPIELFSLAGTLEDSHLVHLSQMITSKAQLRHLGIIGLKLKKEVVETALHNHRTIGDAAYNVVSMWTLQWQHRSEAFTNLIASLRKCQMNQLANELQQTKSQASSEALTTETESCSPATLGGAFPEASSSREPLVPYHDFGFSYPNSADDQASPGLCHSLMTLICPRCHRRREPAVDTGNCHLH